MPAKAQVEDRVRALPDTPGIYIFKDAEGAALYVGKAKSLRKRVLSYLGGDLETRLLVMVAEAAELDFVVTDSEAEALLLENNWIKQRQPRFNIRLRDDKTYPYLKITLQEAWPRLVFTRRIRHDGAEYFGPFLPAGLARKAIKLVQKLFGLRVCRIEIDGKLPRPCLYFDMHRCLGPCVDGLTTRETYQAAVEQARLFLSGRGEQLVKRLRGEMEEASQRLDFEHAARLRDAIAEVESIAQRRKLSSELGDDVDIFGVHVRGGNAAVVVLVMRGGQVLDRRELFWEGQQAVDAGVLLGEVLPQLYERTTFIPKEIHLPLPVEGGEALEAWLSQRKEERVYLRLPARGTKVERVKLAMHNAETAYRRRFRGAKEHAGAEALARQLRLPEPPRRIEGFDISHLQGSEIVASLVVWEESRMRKGEYRSFNMRGMPEQDDFAAIEQAVERRYRRRLEEVGEMPDLILIDGGRGQLNAALAALSKLGVEETPVVSLAKQQEEIYSPDRPAPLRLPRNDPGLQLLQQIRDESHRFAVARHRSRRASGTLRSRFDELRGVGPRRKKALVQRFGSWRGLQAAAREELVELLGASLGGSVYEQVRATSAEVRAAAATAGPAQGPAPG